MLVVERFTSMSVAINCTSVSYRFLLVKTQSYTPLNTKGQLGYNVASRVKAEEWCYALTVLGCRLTVIGNEVRRGMKVLLAVL
jgi:hypothetical protein